MGQRAGVVGQRGGGRGCVGGGAAVSDLPSVEGAPDCGSSGEAGRRRGGGGGDAGGAGDAVAGGGGGGQAVGQRAAEREMRSSQI